MAESPLWSVLVPNLLTAPDSQLDGVVRPFIEKWKAPPKAAEVLEVLDLCIHDSLASGLVIKLLHMLYDEACKAEGTTHDEVAATATWRQAL